MLPLINRRWARILRVPSHAWESADLPAAGVDQRPLNPMAAIMWFLRRSG